MPKPQKKLNVGLVELARAGDQEAFATLYDDCKFDIYIYLAGLVGTVDASDLMQDTFIKAYNKLSTLQDLSKFASWLYRIARNCAYDYIRGRHRNGFHSSADVQEMDMLVSH